MRNRVSYIIDRPIGQLQRTAGHKRLQPWGFEETMTTVPTPNPACDGARQILAAALEAFAEHGYKGASVHAIAERAGVSKANVFHHFASKEQLYLTVLRQASLGWREDIARMADATGPFPARLRAMVDCILKHLLNKTAESRLLLREVLENGALRGRRLSEEVFAGNFDIEMAIFRRAQAEGDLRPGLDPVIAWVTTIAACLFFFQSRDVLRFNPAFPYADAADDYAAGICDVLLRGIAEPIH